MSDPALEPSPPLEPPASVRDAFAHLGKTPSVPLTPLKGGAISATARIATNTGETFVAKWLRDGPPEVFVREAEALEALALPGCPRVPSVVAVGADFLLLEDLGAGAERAPDYWERIGRQMATLHGHTHPTFGYDRDNYLGLAVQRNPPTADGHAFYARHRLLRYVDEGLCRDLLTPDDRRRLERLCDRLPALVPVQPASLCHGDLWLGNLVVAGDGAPAVVDPAIHYGWAEADLAMTTQYGRFEPPFYDAYQEVRPLDDGWEERFEIYHLKEWLSMVAHFGERHDSLIRVREILQKFA